MIQYVDKLLHDWARWSRVRQDGGRGFSPIAFGFDLVPSSGSGSHCGDGVVIDEQSMEIEQIVVCLRKERSDLFSVVDWYYLAGNVTVGRIAKELGCSRDTVYVRLHQLHEWVLEKMRCRQDGHGRQ